MKCEEFTGCDKQAAYITAEEHLADFDEGEMAYIYGNTLAVCEEHAQDATIVERITPDYAEALERFDALRKAIRWLIEHPFDVGIIGEDYRSRADNWRFPLRQMAGM